MIRRMPTNCGDETCPSCVIAGDFIFLAHPAGGLHSDDVAVQMEACFDKMKKTLESVGRTLGGSNLKYCRRFCTDRQLCQENPGNDRRCVHDQAFSALASLLC
jgi:hypothetical protein